MFLTFLITKTSLNQCGMYAFAKTFLYFDILTSRILNLGFLSISLLESIFMFYFTSTGFILIVLCYVLLYLLTKSSNLSIIKFFELTLCFYKFYLLKF